MKKYLWKVLFILLVLFSISSLYFLRIKNDMIDFEVYWKSGKRFASVQSLYVQEDGHYVLKYIPFFAFLILPFSFLPLQISKASWFSLSILFLIIFFHFSLKLVPEKRLKKWIILLVSGIFILKFIVRELDLGQTNIFMGALFLIGFDFLYYRKNFLSGLFLALSFVAKPYSAISLPYLLIKKRFLPFIYSTFLMISFLLVPSFFYGIKGNFRLIRSWLATIFSSTPHLLFSNDNVSIMGMFSKWLGIGHLSLILSILTILFLLFLFTVAVLKGKGSNSPDNLEISILLIFVPLFSPQGWDYVFLLSLPAIMIAINYYDKLPLALKIFIAISLITIGFSLFDLMGRKAYEKFMELSVITISYFVIIFSLFYMRIRKIV